MVLSLLAGTGSLKAFKVRMVRFLFGTCREMSGIFIRIQLEVMLWLFESVPQ